MSSGGSGSGSAAKPANMGGADPRQDLQARYDGYKSQLSQIAARVGDLETERDEHRLVLAALEKLPADRPCFRMSGSGVLVRRTVDEVRPLLATNADGIDGVMDALMKQYKTVEDDFQKFQRDNKIKVVRG